MESVIQVECRLAGQILHRKEVATITRAPTPLRPEHVGLTPHDGKTVMSALQHTVITDQVEVEAAAWWTCSHCQRHKRIKDRRCRRLRTIFGEVVVCCRRYHYCTCRGGRPRIEWPLRHALPARTTPQYAYLLAKWGARMPYRRAAALLRALLPLRRSDISYGSVRRWTLDTGRRIENRAIDPEEYEWESTGRTPVPAADHVQVAIDGTWIRAAPGAYGRQLHVVAGRIERDGRLGGHFAWLPEATGHRRHNEVGARRSRLDGAVSSGRVRGWRRRPRIGGPGGRGATAPSAARLVPHQHAAPPHRTDGGEGSVAGARRRSAPRAAVRRAAVALAGVAWAVA